MYGGLGLDAERGARTKSRRSEGKRRCPDHFLDVDRRRRFNAGSAVVCWAFRYERFGSTRRLFFFLAVAADARFLAIAAIATPSSSPSAAPPSFSSLIPARSMSLIPSWETTCSHRRHRRLA